MSAEAGAAKFQGCSLEGLRRTLEWEEKAGPVEQKNAEALQRLKRAVQDLQASEATMKERFDYMEERHQREMQHVAREADLREIRELVGCEKLSLQDYLGSMKELLAGETEARELHLNSVLDFLNQRAATCEGRIQELQERLTNEVASRERQCGAVQAACLEALRGQQEHAQERLERSERLAGEAAVERSERLEASFDHALQEHHSSVRECISGLERLLQDFVEEHSNAQGAAREDFAQLDQQMEMRLVEERARREAQIGEIRELVRNAALDGKIGAGAPPLNVATALPAELHSQLSDEAIEERFGALRTLLAQELEVREARLREANAAALQDFLQKLNERLQAEFQREEEGRAADVSELRKLIGDDKSSYAEVLRSVNDIISREQEARVQFAQEVQHQLSTTKANHDHLEQCMTDRWAAMEEQLLSGKLNRTEAGEKSAMGLLHRANKDFELRLTGHQEKVLQHVVAQKEQILAHSLEVEAQFKVLSERLESQLQIMKEGVTATWKEQLRVVENSWEQQHENLKDLVASERDARERSLACLQALVQRGKEDQIRLEKQLHERQLEATRERSLDLLHGEAEEQLQVERAALETTARELVAAERGARERSHAALHDLLKCESEAMKDLVSQEREARSASQSALKDSIQHEREAREDAVQREREVRERHLDSHRQDLARERALREEANKALMEAFREQQAGREEDKLDQQRMASLERTACIFDGLVRAERAERTAESRRLWDALDNHTHDIQKQKVITPFMQAVPAVVAPMQSAATFRAQPQRSLSAKTSRPSMVSRPSVAAVRCLTPPCHTPAVRSYAGPSTQAPVGCGSAQRAVSPTRQQMLPVPTLPLFPSGASVGASPCNDAVSTLWACGSVSTLASEATATPPALAHWRSSSSSGARSPQGNSCQATTVSPCLLSPSSAAFCGHAESIACGSTRYLGEPHTSAEVLTPM